MASNVIDVGALGPYALEASAYSERVRLYTARVGGVGGTGGAGARVSRPPRLLADVPAAERQLCLAAHTLSTQDKDLVSVMIYLGCVNSLREAFGGKGVESNLTSHYGRWGQSPKPPHVINERSLRGILGIWYF